MCGLRCATFGRRRRIANCACPPCLDACSTYDAIVVGLGAHGSAALYNLAKWGDRVLGIERWAPGHDNASHHGLTRITRTAYHESPHYVPLLQKSFQLYRELERESEQAGAAGSCRACAN